MEKQITFCETCRKDVTYSVRDIVDKGKLGDKEYTFNGKRAACNECGAEVWVHEIADSNLRALYESYEKSKAQD
jgi:uncharacterized protein with PIN domain